jgi:hypothetical protein
MSARHLFERGFAIVRRLRAKPFALKIHARELHDGGLVIDEEDEFVGHFDWLFANRN